MSTIIKRNEISKVYIKRNGELHQCHTCLRKIPYKTEVNKIEGIEEGDGWFTTLICIPCNDFIYDHDLKDDEDKVEEGCVLECLNGVEQDDPGEYSELKIEYFGINFDKW